MSPTHTIKVVEWRATRYGVVAAFQCVTMAKCATNEETRLAVQILDALAEHFYAAADAYTELVTGKNTMLKSWPEDCAAFEKSAGDGYPIALSPQAFAFLKAKLADWHQESGALARLRIAADESLDRAQEKDVAVATP